MYHSYIYICSLYDKFSIINFPKYLLIIFLRYPYSILYSMLFWYEHAIGGWRDFLSLSEVLKYLTVSLLLIAGIDNLDKHGPAFHLSFAMYLSSTRSCLLTVVGSSVDRADTMYQYVGRLLHQVLRHGQSYISP